MGSRRYATAQVSRYGHISGQIHHRLYTGKRADLKGRMALVIKTTHPDIVMAQFDCRSFKDLGDPMCFDWHKLPALSFRSKRVRP